MRKKHIIPIAGLVTGYAMTVVAVWWFADDYAMLLFGLSALYAKVYLISLFTLVLVVRLVLIMQGKDKVANFIDRWFQ